MVNTALSPGQIGPLLLIVGVVGSAFTVTDIVALVAHTPAAGVNVYMVVPAAAVLIVKGLHVPAIPLVDVVGKVPGVAPTQ